LSKICVSIATDRLVCLKKQIEKAFVSGADFVEIRFDFLHLTDIENALKLVENFKSKAVFTIRSKEEGGKFRGSNKDRITLLKKLSLSRPMLLDVEFNTIKNAPNLLRFLRNRGIRTLISWHDFDKTPSNDKLIEILHKMKSYSYYVKIVTTAHDIQDALRVLNLYRSTGKLHLIAFAMGDAGIISRIFCTTVGAAPFTYAALDEGIAPGQLTVSQMREIYNRINTQHRKQNADPS
jgi:3-dehydroquinate dehydratase I